MRLVDGFVVCVLVAVLLALLGGCARMVYDPSRGERTQIERSLSIWEEALNNY